MSVNAQLIDLLGASGLTYSDAAGTHTPSVAYRLHQLLQAGNSNVKATSEDLAFWTAVNGLRVTEGTTMGVDRGFGSAGIVDCIGAAGFVDLTAYVAGLTGGWVLNSMGHLDIILQTGRNLYGYWGSDAAVIAGCKVFCQTLKAAGKIVIWHSAYPIGDTYNGLLVPLYAAMAAWLPSQGMYYIDLYGWCVANGYVDEDGFLPPAWLDTPDASKLHLGTIDSEETVGPEEIANYLHTRLIEIFDIQARI